MFNPKVEEGQARPSKFSDFKPIVSAKTPVSMMQNSAEATDPYRDHSKGVVPGYQGHVPRARDTFGTTAVGGLAPEPHVGAHKKLGIMSGHDRTDRVLGWEEPETVYPAFSEKKLGVMPGYAGFRPGSRDNHAKSAFGGIAHSGPMGQGPDLKSGWDKGRGGPGVDYKMEVKGILPGYKGHVPEAILKAGTSHFGGVRQGESTKGAQMGHEYNGNAFDKAYEVDKLTKSGYMGHVPGARDTYGTTVCNPE